MMEWAMLITTALRSLGIVLNNPLLGGGSSQKVDEAAELLQVLATLIEQGDDAYDDLKEFTEMVRQMAAEGRGPTRIELAGLRERKSVAHDRLQAVKDQLLNPQQEEEGEDGEESEEETEPATTTETNQTTGEPSTDNNDTGTGAEGGEPPAAQPGEGVAVPGSEGGEPNDSDGGTDSGNPGERPE